MPSWINRLVNLHKASVDFININICLRFQDLEITCNYLEVFAPENPFINTLK
jgi:hypothetical protein